MTLLPVFLLYSYVLTYGENNMMIWNGKIEGDVVTVTGEQGFVISPLYDLSTAGIFHFDYQVLLDIGVMLASNPVEKTVSATNGLVNSWKCKICNKNILQGVMKKNILKNYHGIPYYKPTTNCEYYHSFNFKSAEGSTKRDPCTNRPAECPLDGYKRIGWTYNLMGHINADHKGENIENGFAVNDREKRKISGRFCPKNWVYRPGSNSCYLITTVVRRPWLEAKLACEASDAYLLKLENEEERLWILKQLGVVQSKDQLRTSEWWLGLNDRKKKMKWVWTDETPVDSNAIVWNDHEPNNWGGAEWCAELWGHGLNDKSCSTVQAYICERPKDLPFQCDNDQGWEYYHGTCYKYFTEQLDWNNAKLTCEKEDSAMITILDSRDQFYVNDEAKNNHRSMWIGLQYVQDTEASNEEIYKWKWINGEELSLNYWNGGRFPNIEDDKNCAFVDPYIKTVNIWLPGLCSETKPFICQKKTGSCATGWEKHQDSCYHFYSLYRLTQAEAATYCQAQGGHIADIDSAYDQTFFNTKLNELHSVGVERFWIGLTADSNGEYKWTSGDKLTFANWHLEDDINSKSDKQCVFISTDDVEGKWRPVSSCEDKESFVCEISTDVPVKIVPKPTLHYQCSVGWVQLDNYCYLFNSTRLSWVAARSSCRERNSHLIKVSNKRIQNLLYLSIFTDEWIGLNDRSKEKEMVWESDGTKLNKSFTNWLKGEPDNQEGHENCVALVINTLGLWADFDCNRKFAFICQRLADNVATDAPPLEPFLPVYHPGCGPQWEMNPTDTFCYHFSDEQLTWFDARATCYHNGGELVSITGIHEQFFIAGRIRSMSSIAMWLGANDLTREGVWRWNDKSPMSYFNWGTEQPDNFLNQENCAIITTFRSLWYDSNCQLRNGYICKKKGTPLEPTSPLPMTTIPSDYYYRCTDGWQIFNNRCYKIVTDRYTWYEAKKNCRTSGGDLMSINSNLEQVLVKAFANDVKTMQIFWIGLNDLHHEGTYTWSSGDKVTYTNWNIGEPNNFQMEDCVLISSIDGHWSDYKCNSKEGSICVKDMELVKKKEDVGCLPGFLMASSKCIMHVNIYKKWHEAEAYCRHELKGQLAIINNFYMQHAVNKGPGRKKLFRYWISPESNNGRFKYWERGYRANLVDGTCLTLGRNLFGKWEPLPCSLKCFFVCSTPLVVLPKSTTAAPTITTTEVKTTTTTTMPTTTEPSIPLMPCPGRWKFFQNYCYREYSTYLHGLSWSRARESCQDLTADLVSIHSDEELAFLRTNVMKRSKYSYWIGAHIEEDGSISWSDSTPADYTLQLNPITLHIFDKEKKRKSYPYCAVIRADQDKFYTEDCGLHEDWICKFKQYIPEDFSNVTLPKITYCKSRELKSHPHFNGYCYSSPLDFKRVSWHSSRTLCEVFGKRLITIHSKAENEFLRRVFGLRTYMWIGIHTHVSELDNSWTDQTKINYTNWAEGEPVDPYHKPCVAIDTLTGKWHSFSCYKQFPALCEALDNNKMMDAHVKGNFSGGCPLGFVAFEKKCFLIGGTGIGKQLNWHDAQKECRSNGKLFGLASVEGTLEQAFLTKMLYSVNVSLWIGMRMGADYLTWMDNSPISFVNLDSREIQELLLHKSDDCIAMHTEPSAAGLWFRSNCHEFAGYICQGYRNNSLSLVTKKENNLLPGYVKYQKAFYKFVNDTMFWEDAKKYCENDKSHLVSIHSAYEDAFVRLLGGYRNNEFWMGAKEKNNQITWSDGWPMHFTDWPVVTFENETCGLFTTLDKWNLVDCNDKFPFVCKITSEMPPKVDKSPVREGKCPPKWYPIHNRCFQVNDILRSWPEAEYECAQLGANLASFHSLTDINFSKIIGRLRFSRLDSIWIGLSMVDRTLHWEDNSPVDFLNFMHGGATLDGKASYSSDQIVTKNCVIIDLRTGLWRRISCFHRLPFFCMTQQIPLSTSDESCTNCSTRTPVTEKKTGLTTGQIVGIFLVVPFILIISAIIPYIIIKRKTVRISTDGEGFVNSLYEAPNLMVMKEEIEKSPS